MDIENDLKELDTLQISILFWRQRGLSDKEIGKKFGRGEDWVEARMGEIYKDLGFDPKMHARQKKQTLEDDYLPVVKVLTNDDPDTLPDWPLKAKPVDQNRPTPPASTRRPTKTVDQPRPSPRSIWRWLWIPILLLFVGALYITYIFGRNSVPQSPATSAATATSDAQANSSPTSSTPLLTDTSQFTDTSTNTLTPTLTFTPTVTLTPMPTDTKSPLTKDEELSDSRVTLQLQEIKYNQGRTRVGQRPIAPIVFIFDFTNQSGETILLQIDQSNFKVKDNLGNEANCEYWQVVETKPAIELNVSNGQTVGIGVFCGEGSIPSQVTTYTLYVTDFSSLPDSTWVHEVAR